MTENDDHRIVSGEDEDGTRYTITVPHTPWNDQLSDDQIITSLHEWMTNGPQPTRDHWPIPQPFGQWLMATKPGPKERCPDCGTPSLRTATPPDNPAGEKRVVCTMIRCEASPFYRA